MRQAPDTAEFRIYLHPGTHPPAPDAGVSTNWDTRFYVVPYDQHVTLTTDDAGRTLRRYEVLLPQPGDTDRRGVPLSTSQADPIAYAHVGVSTADNKSHTADDPKWTVGNWGDRDGNEGRIGTPAKIFRVHREVPEAPPVPPPDSAAVYATPADYHGHSFHTYRWQPAANLKAHIFRALDDTLFKTDWKRHPRPVLDPNGNAEHLTWFPSEAAEPAWDALKRRQVADELNALSDVPRGDAVTAQAMAYYQSLSNDGLRVLAGLPGNERGFTQLTIQPLDPDDPANANRLGPDDTSSAAVDPSLRAYVDTLDGRATNRYFYRSAYVDGAHNRSHFSLATVPVYLPDVVPPNAPVVTKVAGGDRQITLRWTTAEASVVRYLVYRTKDRERTRDVRLLGDPLASLPATVLVTQGNQVNLGAGTDVITVEKVYIAAELGTNEDPITGGSATQLLATPTAPAGTVVSGLSASDGTQVVVVYRDSNSALQRTPISGRAEYWNDQGLSGLVTYYYGIVSVKQSNFDGQPWRVPSPLPQIIAAKAFDVAPPAPAQWQNAQWVKVDATGNEHPWPDTVDPFTAAIKLVWTTVTADVVTMIQRKDPEALLWHNITGWRTGAQEYLDKQVDATKGYHYRIRSRRINGQTSLSATISVPGV